MNTVKNSAAGFLVLALTTCASGAKGKCPWTANAKGAAGSADAQPASNALFIDESGKTIDLATYERPEQVILSKHMPRGAKVLELGARLGVSTCVISKRAGAKGVVVAVEPDATVIPILKRNLAENACPAIVLNGVIGDNDVVFHQNGLSSKTTPIPLSRAEAKNNAPGAAGRDTAVRAIKIRDLEKRYAVRFDALVADCEGCIEGVLNHLRDAGALGQFAFVCFERDEGASDYGRVDSILRSSGLEQVVSGFHAVWKRPIQKNTKH